MNEKVIRFRRFALAATIATYLLIFIGGLVRVSGAGLGCPDWPKCFGRWIPPLSINQLPQGFDAASFNLTLAWIEYLNRLAGMLTGMIILITAILAIKNFRDNKKILIPSVSAAILVAIQGWYGSIVVKSQLMPLTISIHMFLALVIVSLLIYTTLNAYLADFSSSGLELQSYRRGLLLFWMVVLIQILLGTEIRSQVEMIWENFPLLSSSEVLARIGIAAILHTLLGILLIGGVIILSIRLLPEKRIPILYKQVLMIAIAMVFLQVLIGSGLSFLGITAILQVFHLWLASILIGTVLFIYTGLLYKEADS